MRVHHLAKENSILNRFLFEIREVSVQNDSMRFRRNIERIGEIISYEVSKKLSFESSVAKTPLGDKSMFLPTQDIVIGSILRAGLPLHFGLLNYFDNAENAFISAYRYHPNNDADFEIKVEYFAAPNLDDKVLLLADPMLATGQSLVAVLQEITKHSSPKEIHLICIIASKEGIDFVEKNFPENTTLWIADIDDDLNNFGYIIPGLGDAGDLSFGTKL